MKPIFNSLHHRIWWAAFLMVVTLGCEENKTETAQVLLASDPPSIVLGESRVMTVTAAEDFFVDKVIKDLESDLGMVIAQMEVVDARHAHLELSADSSDFIGLHELLVEQDNKVGRLQIGVIQPQPGPGTVSADLAMASAGARRAEMNIYGNGTHFDQDVEVFVKDAEHVKIDTINILGNGYISLSFSIDLDQAPGQAAFVIVDGFWEYEVPLTIVTPQVFPNVAGTQLATRGRWNYIMMENSEAYLSGSTVADTKDTGLSTYQTQSAGEGVMALPVYVPEDYADSSAQLGVSTLYSGGSILELMELDLEIVDAQYMVATPSVVSSDSCPSAVTAEVVGGDANDIDTLELEGNAQLVDWSVSDDSHLQINICGQAGFDGHPLYLKATGDSYDAKGLMVLQSETRRSYVEPHELRQDEVVTATLVISGGVLVEDDIKITGPSEIEVLNFSIVDDNAIIINVGVGNNATINNYSLGIESGGLSYYADFKILHI